MDELERALRETLSDDRLDLPLPPGAVAAVREGVRRRRRHRQLFAAAATALVVAGGTGGILAAAGAGGRAVVAPGEGHASPAATGTPSVTSSPPAPARADAAVVDWAGLPYDPAHPVVLAGARPDPHVPWCGAEQLSFTAAFQGSGGMSLGRLIARNTGAACGLQGVPSVTGLAADGRPVARPTPRDDFVEQPWLRLGPGQQATLTLGLAGLGSRCVGPVDRLRLDLGHGGRPAVVPAVQDGTGGRGVVPAHCGDGTADTYSVVPAAWRRSDGTPRLGWEASDLGVTVQPARTAMQGTILRYRIELRSRTADLDTCLPFRQTVTTTGPHPTVVTETTNLLPCQSMQAAGGDDWLLDMQVPLPSSAPVGTVSVRWEAAVPDLAASTGPIQVVAAPPYCRQDQLSVGAGRAGAAAGTYYDAVVFTNTSSSDCSLRGYPGVQFVDDKGRPLPTHPERDTLHDVETVALPAGGGTASFYVSGGDFAPPAGATPCRPVHGLLVIAPNLTTQMPVDAGADCDHESIRVYPVVAGSRPRP